MENIYDVIILGAGPAGLSAGLYCGRNRLKTLIIEKGVDGGQIAITNEVENYPGGKPEGETGPELIARFTEQAKRFGCERVTDHITSAELEGDVKVLRSSKNEYKARKVILATGSHSRLIDCPGEAEFTGRGVSYCATCDGSFFEGLEVYVVGGGDTAVEEAMYLTRFARKVSVIHRRDELRAAKSIQERAFANPKMNFIWDSVVEELSGGDLLDTLVLRNVKTNEKTVLKADEEDGLFGVFVFIGYLPNNEIFKDVIETEWGYAVTDEEMRTSVPGVYAVGDVRKKSLRQVVTAAADGAIAAMQIDHELAAEK